MTAKSTSQSKPNITHGNMAWIRKGTSFLSFKSKIVSKAGQNKEIDHRACNTSRNITHNFAVYPDAFNRQTLGMFWYNAAPEHYGYEWIHFPQVNALWQNPHTQSSMIMFKLLPLFTLSWSAQGPFPPFQSYCVVIHRHITPFHQYILQTSISIVSLLGVFTGERGAKWKDSATYILTPV